MDELGPRKSRFAFFQNLSGMVNRAHGRTRTYEDGVIEAKNSDGTFDVRIPGRPWVYQGIMQTGNEQLEPGFTVRIVFEDFGPQKPVILTLGLPSRNLPIEAFEAIEEPEEIPFLEFPGWPWWLKNDQLQGVNNEVTGIPGLNLSSSFFTQRETEPYLCIYENPAGLNRILATSGETTTFATRFQVQEIEIRDLDLLEADFAILIERADPIVRASAIIDLVNEEIVTAYTKGRDNGSNDTGIERRSLSDPTVVLGTEFSPGNDLDRLGMDRDAGTMVPAFSREYLLPQIMGFGSQTRFQKVLRKAGGVSYAFDADIDLAHETYDFDSSSGGARVGGLLPYDPKTETVFRYRDLPDTVTAFTTVLYGIDAVTRTKKWELIARDPNPFYVLPEPRGWNWCCDDSGNLFCVMIRGETGTTGPERQIYMQKRSPADGSLIWETQYTTSNTTPGLLDGFCLQIAYFRAADRIVFLWNKFHSISDNTIHVTAMNANDGSIISTVDTLQDDEVSGGDRLEVRIVGGESWFYGTRNPANGRRCIRDLDLNVLDDHTSEPEVGRNMLAVANSDTGEPRIYIVRLAFGDFRVRFLS